ncbi:DUF421 domain-containing protein [Carboxydothermus islandicus]|uniref:DUF421 domain-containing protein n=1 Tax=Carboxydothermus islandicus TaxID=661089 RepID=UPI00096A474F|nr:YetF domain-containing protein [Carboxydothermus islandicus]
MAQWLGSDLLVFHPYGQIIFSSVIVYLFIVLLIRLFGKQELAQLSIFDLVFIMLIGNAVQNAMVGSDTTLSGGLVAAASLFFVNYLVKYITYRFPKFGKMIQGEAVMLIYQGKIIKENMAKAKISLKEIEEAIREHGVSSIEDVDLAVLEIDGSISVLSNEFRRKTSKKRKAPVYIRLLNCTNQH